MFRLTNKDRIKFLKERNVELTNIIKELSDNNKNLININSSLLKQLKLKNNKINDVKKYAKAIIDIWKDVDESDTASLLVLDFEHVLNILDGEENESSR